jgi:uncharacterized membrane protein YhaH (DUF805 family)
MSYFIKVLKNYAVFSGRARRMEYWYFQLFCVLFSILFYVLDAVLNTPKFGSISYFDVPFQPISTIYWLALLIPCISVGARRLHDIGCSGWWQLLMFVPVVGSIILVFAFLIRPSQDGENQYGRNPIEK